MGDGLACIQKYIMVLYMYVICLAESGVFILFVILSNLRLVLLWRVNLHCFLLKGTVGFLALLVHLNSCFVQHMQFLFLIPCAIRPKGGGGSGLQAWHSSLYCIQEPLDSIALY